MRMYQENQPKENRGFSDNSLPWEHEGWISEVVSWLSVNLASRGLTMTGPPQQIHRQPWSTVFRVPTDRGDYYFKALCPLLRHEAALPLQLSAWQPEVIQPVISIDALRGWMLMPEGGTTLRQIHEKDPSLDYWKKIIPQYARLQIALIPRCQEILELGVENRSLQRLPGYFSELLSDKSSLRIGLSEGLTHTDYQRLLSQQNNFQSLCKELSSWRVPETMQHDDLHDGNIFYHQGGVKFFDWAESFIAHPFFTMVVALRSIAYRFDLSENSGELAQLRDVYLLEWQNYGSTRELLEAFRLAMIVGRVNRALTWYTVVKSLPEPYRSKEAGAMPGWLRLFLEKI